MLEGDRTLVTGHDAADGDRVAAEAPVFAARRYQVLDEVARGGGGRIVRARDLGLDRVVAIKEPLPGRARQVRAEAEVLIRLQHPSIVPIYDAGMRDDGTPFFVMKLVAGRPLREVMRDAASLERRLALVPAVVAVADAMAYSHSVGVVHRDLKPANVLCGEFGETIVIDWGLATDHHSAGPGAAVGTPAYMPPEQARGDAVDTRADVYALGAILYHLLVGAPPYADAGDVLTALGEGPPPPVIDLQPRAPRDLVAIVTKAMAREPGARYPSARELAEDLTRFQAGRLVTARRYSPVARARRWLARRRGAVAAAGVAAAAAAGLAVMAMPGRPAAAPACAHAGAEIAAVWDPARAGLDPVTTATLDDYAARWAEARQAVCEATSVHHTQSPELLDARMTCLDQRRDQLAALLALVGGRPDLAARAPEMAQALAPIADCDDAGVLRGLDAQPGDPGTRAAIAATRRAIAAAKVVQDAGEFEPARALTRVVVATARSLGYRPLLAEALYQDGRAALRTGDYDGAEASLLEAVSLAEASHHDGLAAQIWNRLVYLPASSNRGLERLDHWLPRAWTSVARLGDPPRHVAGLENVLGVVSARRDDLDGAMTHFERAVTLWRSMDQPDFFHYGSALNALGAFNLKGRWPSRARPYLEESLALIGSRLGPHHPSRALPLQNLARLALATGDLDQAASRCTELEAQVQPEPRHAFEVVRVCGSVQRQRGDPAGALARLDALTPELERYGDDALRVDHEVARGQALVALGRHREAIDAFTRAVDLDGTSGGLGWARDRAKALIGRSAAHRGLGERAAALADAEGALAALAPYPDQVIRRHAALLAAVEAGAPRIDQALALHGQAEIPAAQRAHALRLAGR